MTNGSTYYFKVAATNSVGTSLYSSVSAAVVPKTVPSAPAAPAVVAGSASVTVSWVAPASNGAAITGYNVQWSATSAGTYANSTGCVSLGVVLTCTATGLTNGSTYYFKVAATNSVGTGNYSLASTSVAPSGVVSGAPTAPTVAAGNGQVTVSWVAPTNTGSAITGYNVTKSTTSSGTYANATGCTALDVVLTCTATGLTNGTTYYFKVAATNSSGTSAYSSASAGRVTSEPMTLTIDTTKYAANLFSLPTSGTVNVAVDWGDESAKEIVTTAALKTHTYAVEGTYQINIYGSMTQYGSTSLSGSNGSPLLTAVTQWGTLGITSLSSAFTSASSLTSVPSNLPASVTDVSRMFHGAQSFNQNIGTWDTGNVTNMSYMLHGASAFNNGCALASFVCPMTQSVGAWNTSAVTNMSYMFSSTQVAANYVIAFNQDISSWDTSAVTNMSYMFNYANAFNNGCASGVQSCLMTQSVGAWSTSYVTNMSFMFDNALAFNQRVDTWNTLRVTNMQRLFYGAVLFNQSVSNWDTKNVTTMAHMFGDAFVFNNGCDVGVLTCPMTQSDGAWNTSSVTSMQSMFYSARKFNQRVDTWDTRNVTNMLYLFGSQYANVFNNGCASGDRTCPMTQTVGAWNTASVTDMRYMFINAAVFNQHVDSWDTRRVTTMFYMFNVARLFNNGCASGDQSCPMTQSVGAWNTSAVTDMSFMFGDASVFNQDISSWSTALVTRMRQMFYSATKFNQNIGSWTTSAVTTMSSMFWLAQEFNQDIGSWDTAAVTDMSQMFQYAYAFNQNIGSWNTARVTNMYYMFYFARAFNQNLGNWNVSAITGPISTTGVTHMLTSSGISAANYDAALIGWDSRSVLPSIFSANFIGYTSASAAARSSLIAKGWAITDFGLATVPEAPAAAPGGTVGSQRVTLTWAAPTSNGGDVITGYNVQWSSTSGGTYVDATGCTALGVVLTCVATGLTAGAPYYFKVAAINGQGTGTYSRASSVKTPT